MSTIVYEMTDIMAELTSEYIYESIMIESEASDTTKGKTMGQKLKGLWQTFCKFVKTAVKSVKEFIRKAATKIKDNAIVKVNDIEPVMARLREFLKDIETDEGIEKLNVVDAHLPGSKIYDMISKDQNGKSRLMKRIDAVKMFEKTISELESMSNRLTKTVDKLVKELENASIVTPEMVMRVKNINTTKAFLEGFLSGTINNLQECVNQNSTNKDKPSKE